MFNRIGWNASVLLLGFSALIIYSIIDSLFYKGDREAKERIEKVSYWSESTVEYFDHFNCENLNNEPVGADILSVPSV